MKFHCELWKMIGVCLFPWSVFHKYRLKVIFLELFTQIYPYILNSVIQFNTV